MPRDLFGDVTRPSISIGNAPHDAKSASRGPRNRKWYTVPVSLLSHVAIVAVMVAAPLLATGVLPTPYESIEVVFDDVPTPPPPPPPPPRYEITDPPPIQRDLAPIDAPSGINPEPPEPPRDPVDPRGDSIIVGATDLTSVVTPPPPPPARHDPVRVGGAIRQPQKIKDVAPIYPPIAQAARVQGIVIIEATIGPDGQVTNARILRSVPLLDDSALDAVRQWQYTPTLLNGVPVPVIMTVTVQFTLSK